MQPQNYERRVFLAVTGLSPQIVTESLYAMSIDCDEEARFIPTEIHLLTTVRGSEHARLNLLSKSPGQFYRFCQDYPGLGLEDIEFSEENIHIISDSQGNFLEDIRNSHENNVAADYITLLIRELTADTELALHVSIAGGRKTMGYYLGYALSLYGREQDRLSHVLVSDPYEKNRDFYYPTPAESVIHVMENGGEVAYDCRNAIIDLAGIPFVRLRQGLPGDLLNGNASFTRVVAEAQKALPDESVLLSLEKHELYLSGEIIKMPPALLAFYAMAAHRRQQAKSGIHWTEEGLADEYMYYYRQAVNPNSGIYERTEAGIKNGISQQFIEQKKSKVNRRITQVLGERMAQPYLLVQQQNMVGTQFRLIGINVNSENIQVG